MISEWVLFKSEFIHQQDSPITQEIKKENKKNKTKHKKNFVQWDIKVEANEV